MYLYKQFAGKPAAEVSYKNKLTYRSVPVLSTMRVPRVPQSELLELTGARAIKTRANWS